MARDVSNENRDKDGKFSTTLATGVLVASAAAGGLVGSVASPRKITGVVGGVVAAGLTSKKKSKLSVSSVTNAFTTGVAGGFAATTAAGLVSNRKMIDMSNLNMFIPITKIDEEKRLVYGIATAETPDRSGEICDYATTKPLYEKWIGDLSKTTEGKNLGNIRAMHGKTAVGKAISWDFDDENKKISLCAKIVDDADWKKCVEGVYTGFSQGGAYVKRWQDPTDPTMKRYTANPSEVSLVDLPCLPIATFEYVKVGGETEMRKFHNTVEKYSDSEERDSHGRWSGAGVGSAVGEAVGRTAGAAIGGTVGNAIGRTIGSRVGAAEPGGVVGGTIGVVVGGAIGGAIGERTGEAVGDKIAPEKKKKKAKKFLEIENEPLCDDIINLSRGVSFVKTGTIDYWPSFIEEASDALVKYSDSENRDAHGRWTVGSVLETASGAIGTVSGVLETVTATTMGALTGAKVGSIVGGAVGVAAGAVTGPVTAAVAETYGEMAGGAVGAVIGGYIGAKSVSSTIKDKKDKAKAIADAKKAAKDYGKLQEDATMTKNEDVVAHATELAKAAGDETNWPSFILEARTALEKLAEKPAEVVVPPVEKTVVTEPVIDLDVKQVWLAKDNSTHAKKADALAKNVELAEKAAKTPLDEVLSLIDAALERNEVKEPVIEKAFLVSEIKKYLGSEIWDAQSAMNALSSVFSLLRGEMSEDGQDADQIASLNQAIDGLKDFIIAELQEKSEPDQVMTMSVKLGELAKAGSRHNGKDLETIQSIHDSCKTLGCDCGAEKGSGIDDLAKSVIVTETMSKFVAEITPKIEQLTLLTKSQGEELARLKLQPVLPPVLRIVEKGSDISFMKGDKVDSDVMKLFDAMSPEDKAQLMVKMAQQNPRNIIVS